MKIKLIAAIGKNRELGKVDIQKGLFELPSWTLPGDMKHLKDITLGGYLVMGDRTWESLPEKLRPFAGRTSVVLSQKKDYSLPEGVILLNSEEEFVKFALSPFLEGKGSGEGKTIWIFGGAQIYKNLMKYVEEMHITEVNGEFPECNVFFPEINTNEWELISKERGNQETEGQTKKPESHEFYYCVYRSLSALISK